MKSNERALAGFDISSETGVDEFTGILLRLEEAADRFYDEFLAIAKDADEALGWEGFFRAHMSAGWYSNPREHVVPRFIHFEPFLMAIRVARQTRHMNRLLTKDEPRAVKRLAEALGR